MVYKSEMSMVLETLRANGRYQPVEGSPGNWIDTATGKQFHWRQFQLTDAGREAVS